MQQLLYPEADLAGPLDLLPLGRIKGRPDTIPFSCTIRPSAPTAMLAIARVVSTVTLERGQQDIRSPKGER